jgi:hypothetical protein
MGYWNNRVGVLIFTILALGLDVLHSQVENPLLKNKEPFAIHGYINSQLATNSMSGIDPRQDPFNYRVSGSMVVNTYGWKTSINFNHADKRNVYGLNLPDVRIPSYTLLGLSPSYKWATFHLGFRSMHFSEYTLANHSFYGSGIELKPKRFRLLSFYGRLRRASAETMGLRQSLDPAYNRLGWGIKIGYEQDREHLALSIISAHDVVDGVIDLSNNTTLKPQENTVLGITGNKKIGSLISLEIDYALSALTRDALSSEIDGTSLNILQKMLGLFNPKSSSEFRKALKTKISFNPGFGCITLTHERVDPGYRSLGSLFFNNDFENITGGGQFRALENRLMFSVNGGFQRNNISGQESNGLTRFVGSIHASYNYSDSGSIGFSYSNFRTTNTLYVATIPIIQIDSITLSLINQQASLSFNKVIGGTHPLTLTAMITNTQSKSIENDVVQDNQTNDNLMAHLSLNKQIKDSWGLSGSFLLNRNNNPLTNLLTIAPVIGVQKSFQERNISVRSSISLVNVYFNGRYQRRILQPRIGLDYKINNKNSLSVYALMTSQFYSNGNTRDFSELSSRVSWKIRL